MSEVSKQQKAFYRKLYLAHLISTDKHNIPSLEDFTGMPRRTIQDCLKSIGDLNIVCHFTPSEGQRHNHGFLTIDDWGAINPQWVKKNILHIQRTLES